MDSSPGTRSFIADCRRLLDRCAAQAAKGDPVETRASLELIFRLLHHIDECHDDVVFFADEGGAWQVGADWAKVFPAWFRCLSQSAEPEEFARLVVEMVDEFEGHDRERHIAAARKLGTAAQRRALDVVVQIKKERRR